MRHHRLGRYPFPTPDGVLGKFEQWATLEEEERGNKPRVSCIPADLYVCKRQWFNKGGYETFEITNVPGRSDILFHAGNTEEASLGCVLVGKSVGFLEINDEDSGLPTRKLAILDSKKAHKEFMAFFDGVTEWELEIVDLRA